jgi:hypothetical protein
MTIYCVYVTFYRGNKLPPFYIGSSSISKVNKGYNGTVRSKKHESLWIKERKENPHLFVTKILTQHEFRDDALLKEAKFQKSLNATNNPLYINQSIARRGFGNLSIEACQKISKKAKERDYSYMKGSNHHYFGGRTDLNQSGSKNPMAKKCVVKGIIFGSIKEAADYHMITYKKCYYMIKKQVEDSGYYMATSPNQNA